MRPPFAYYGGKVRMARRIVSTAHSSNAAGGNTRIGRIERIWSNRPITEHVELSLFDLEEAPA